MMLGGEEVPIDDNLRQKFKAVCKTLAANGERVLGFVDKDLDKSQFPKGFAFLTEGISYKAIFPNATLVRLFITNV